MAEKLVTLPPDGGATFSEIYEEDNRIILREDLHPAAKEAIKAANQESSLTNPMEGSRKTGMGVVGARIPITTHTQWRQDWHSGPRLWGVPWHKFLKAKLNQVENRHLTFMKV